MIKANDKAVCVDDQRFNPGLCYPCGLVLNGALYCVERLIEVAGETCVVIVGLPVFAWNGQEVGWKLSRFRTISELRQHNLYSTEELGRKKKVLRKRKGARE